VIDERRRRRLNRGGHGRPWTSRWAPPPRSVCRTSIGSWCGESAAGVSAEGVGAGRAVVDREKTARLTYLAVGPCRASSRLYAIPAGGTRSRRWTWGPRSSQPGIDRCARPYRGTSTHLDAVLTRLAAPGFQHEGRRRTNPNHLGARGARRDGRPGGENGVATACATGGDVRPVARGGTRGWAAGILPLTVESGAR